ncbi:hypothetical protein [Amycolatopsis sp. H20-H5]|uniref:hypothetical protein n=1 Tax=Amycolatopsis sp. H20-H5 TaxID=3046309 RepID=UPI002DBEF0DA|nr:hypothetical protein [Amycolatopsis sp. H20-H5]MEC3979865.1 hypothetical protein [Amycolatopsis sp. H20-H5]
MAPPSRQLCTQCGQRAFDVSGLPNSHVRGLTVTNCGFAGVSDPASSLRYVDEVKFTNVTINGKPA